MFNIRKKIGLKYLPFGFGPFVANGFFCFLPLPLTLALTLCGCGTRAFKIFIDFETQNKFMQIMLKAKLQVIGVWACGDLVRPIEQTD